VRHKSDTCKESGELTLNAERMGLEGLVLRCLSCKAERSMKQAFTKKALVGLNCKGNRPWLRSNDSDCKSKGEDGSLRVIQRAGSNAYYPVISSALDIPPWTKAITRILSHYWDDLMAVEPSQRIFWITNTPILLNRILASGSSVEQVVADFNAAEASLNGISGSNLKWDEYAVLRSRTDHDDREFATKAQRIPSSLSKKLESVTRVTRLREIRVLRGFTRINPPFEEDQTNIAPLSVEEHEWLPSMEIKGEGVFFSLNLDSVLAWANDPKTQTRYLSLDTSWKRSFAQMTVSQECPERTSPLFYLVHSLSHAVMNHLTLESGYSSASLRERIYVSSGEQPMAGVLIYTGTADSDGTLGGLQTQGDIRYFEPALANALSSMELCSSDPLCLHGTIANTDSYSLGSCHACLMVPETSCEFNNKFLDRASVTGNLSEFLGFFDRRV
jgi:hypothetical protein